VWGAFDDTFANWDYNNFSHWVQYYPFCSGLSQSPIDISFPANQTLANVVPLQFNYPALSTLTVDEIPTYSARLSNDDNGLSEQLVIPPNSLLPAGSWHFETAHLHWGPTPATGSEHTFNGQHFPMELHLIHRNPKYPDLDTAFKQSDGLLVLATMFQLQTNNNTDLAAMRLEQLTVNTSAVITISNITMAWSHFLPTDASTNYATYFGSLTTPPCNEVVRWVVFRTPLQVSDYQLNLLREIVPSNCRPTLPLNGRNVFYSWTNRSIQISNAVAVSSGVLAFVLFLAL